MSTLTQILAKSTAWLHRFDETLQILDGSASEDAIARQTVLVKSLEYRVRVLETQRRDR